MLNQDLQRKSFDSFGKSYLRRGIELLNEGRFIESNLFIREGLSFLTCDCSLGNWIPDVNFSLLRYPPKDLQDVNSFLLVKAFILSYYSDKKYAYLAHDAITSINDIENDAVALYLQGKILQKLELYQKALESYQKSFEIDPCSRTLYRIGRLKFQHLANPGLEELYQAYMLNPSSACCCRILRESSGIIKDDMIQPPSEEGQINLIEAFHSEESSTDFQAVFEKLLTGNRENMFSGSENDKILSDFITYLQSYQSLFMNTQEEEPDYDERGYDDDSHYNWEPDYDEMYFDAMTDGQLGSYDEFKENGGDLDWIDDWAGR